MDRIPLYLVALIVAIANTPLNIFDVHAWNVGTAHTEPWRHKASAGVTRVSSALRTCWQFLSGHRLAIATAGLLVLVLLAPSAAPGGVLVAIVPGIIPQLETTLREKQTAAKTLLETQMRACEAYEDKDAAGKVIAKGRLRTDEEKGAVQTILDEAKGIKARIDAAKSDSNMLAELDRLTEGMQAAQPARQARVPGQGVIKSLGQAFIDSETYAWLKKNPTRSEGWQAPSSEMPGIELYGTLLTEASGGASLVTPDYRPGILEYLLRPLVVADLIAPGTTDAVSVSYMVESAPTNAAATVAEGATKPESTLVFTARTDAVRKIATWLPVTDEMLEDAPQIRSYIDNRLRGFVQLAEDDQLLNGDGIAPNIEGIRVRAGLQADVVRGADTNADAISKQIEAITVTGLIQPDAIVMHPTNWGTIQRAKDANGQYYGSGPFAAPQVPRLWGLPVAITVAITAGVALPGAYRLGAQFFRRGGLTVAASNSHSTFFVENKTAIRAEERGALAVYRPGGFGEVTGLN